MACVEPLAADVDVGLSPAEPEALLREAPGGQALAWPTDSVHLWLISLQAPPVVEHQACTLLVAEEKARAQRFVAAGARRSYVLTRAVLRRLLRRYHPDLPADFRLSIAPRGKPFLPPARWRPRLAFSVSHSGGLALLGFSARGAVGVDVEQQRPREGLRDIAARVFSASERRWLARLPAQSGLEGFYRLWTAKEAVLKVDGAGFHREPATPCLFAHGNAADTLDEHPNVAGRRVSWPARLPGHALAYAMPASDFTPHRWMDPLHRAGQPLGERLQREVQRRAP